MFFTGAANAGATAAVSRQRAAAACAAAERNAGKHRQLLEKYHTKGIRYSVMPLYGAGSNRTVTQSLRRNDRKTGFWKIISLAGRAGCPGPNPLTQRCESACHSVPSFLCNDRVTTLLEPAP